MRRSQTTDSGTREEKTSRRWLRSCLLAVGLLAALYAVATVVLVQWANRALRGTGPETAEAALSWVEHLEPHGPTEEVAKTLPVGSPLATHILPGVLSVADAEEWGEVWFLLDDRLGAIHRFHPSLGLLESQGRQGKGPGELLDPVAMAVGDTLLWLADQRGMVLDRFSLEHGFQGQTRIQPGACTVGLVKDLVALESGPLILLRFCPSTSPGPGVLWLERLHPSGDTSPFLSLVLSEPGDRRLHPFRLPVFTRQGDEVYLGTLDAPCLFRLRPLHPGEPLERVCLPTYRRPEIPDTARESFGARFRGITRLGFAALDMPRELPWMDGAFGTPRGIVVRRIQGLEERDLIRLSDKETVLLTGLSAGEATFVGEETILVARDRLQGTEIRVYAHPGG